MAMRLRGIEGMVGLVVIGLVVGGAGVTVDAAVAATTPAAVASSDDFNDTALGALPTGWTAQADTGTVGVTDRPDKVDRSLEVAKPGTAGSASAVRTVPAVSGLVRVEARVRGVGVAGRLDVLTVRGSSGPLVSLAIGGGRFSVDGGATGLIAAADDRWYVVRIEMHTIEQRYDLYVDGRRLLANATIAQAPAEVTGVGSGVADGYSGTVDVDNVAVRREPDASVTYVAADQFNDAPLGVAPPGWQIGVGTGQATVDATPSDADRSLRLTKQTTAGGLSATRAFTPQTGTVLVRANLRTDETSGTKLALYAQSSDGKTALSLRFVNNTLQYATDTTTATLVSVTAGEWYTVQLAIDVAAHQFEVYIDGRRYDPPGATGQGVTPRWSFRNTAAADIAALLFGVGDTQTGTVRVDNLLVYQNRPTAPLGTVVDVRSAKYNAVPDGTTDNTVAIQQAIDDVPDGGTLLLTGGVFLTGTIHLKSNMTLWVARGSTLRGSQDDNAYPPLKRADLGSPYFGVNTFRALIYTLDAHDVRIDGGGTIDGNGNKPEWLIENEGPDPAHPIYRPQLLLPMASSNVSIRNVYVTNSAAWGIVPVQVDGLLIADVNLNSDLYANRDGLDITDSDNVLVERTTVWSDDDSICFKSYTSAGVDDATVRLSTVAHSTRANGLKLGTSSVGAFRDVSMEDVLVKHTKMASITVTVVDGAVARNISFRRITEDGGRRAFFVMLGRRSSATDPGVTPRWASGIRLEDIIGTNLVEPSLLAGEALDRTYRIYDTLISNVHTTVAGGQSIVGEPPEWDHVNHPYPESSLWSASTPPLLPAYGLYLRHADGVRIRDFMATPVAADNRNDLTYSDVAHLQTD
jgi:hypothetical protein